MPYLSREQISTPDDTTAVWRYFKLKWFEKFIKSGKLYFSPVCEFNDPWEAAIPKSGLKWRHKKLMEAQGKGDQELQDEFQNILKIEGHRQSFTRAVKASCWHKNDNESEAMWKLYVGSEDGVAVKCTVLDLKNSLVNSPEGVFIGDVNYVDYSDAKFNDVQWYDICYHKREAFSYESELRLAFVNPEELMMKKENIIPVWRYMSFAKFVWTVQNKCLWLSRADLLGDPWEVSLSGKQLQLVIDRHPITPIGEAPKETAEERAKRIIDLWRNNTFISCWNKSPHESNALWKIYCKNTDGVVLQTSYEKLNVIKGRHSLHSVAYPIPGSNNRTPNHTDLVTKKRPMFSYEEEVRIVYYDKNNKTKATDGIRLDFDFELLIESVRVHPEADKSFFDTVQNIVKTYTSNFLGNVAWSDMKLGPPF